MYQVVDFFKYNPDATTADAVSYFEQELAIGEQVDILRKEPNELSRIKKELRPAYGLKAELTEKMKYVISEIEGEVFMEYPPRKGSETEREILRNKLKKSNQNYIDLNAQLKSTGALIDELEDEFADWDRKAKAARRLTELMQAYISFLSVYKAPESYESTTSNTTLF